MKGTPDLIAFNKYFAGSYFGDSEIFCQMLRDSTVMCLTDVNALVLSKDNLTQVIDKDIEVGKKMSMIAFEKAQVHVRKIIDALVNEEKYDQLAKRLYPDMTIKRNTAAEFIRNLITKYIKSKKSNLTKNERKLVRAFSREEDILSSKLVALSPLKIPTINETKQVQKLKNNREKAKYQDDLIRMKKTAKDIQDAALKIKANNRMINSRFYDIQETGRQISQKLESTEDLVYRLLVRVDPDNQYKPSEE